MTRIERLLRDGIGVRLYRHPGGWSASIQGHYLDVSGGGPTPRAALNSAYRAYRLNSDKPLPEISL